jgi:RNA polymerase sigma-70 factor (ECF subfamily)
MCSVNQLSSPIGRLYGSPSRDVSYKYAIGGRAWPAGYSEEEDVMFTATALTPEPRPQTLNRNDQRHPDLESTVDLMDQVKRGDDRALETILQRQIPALQRWAHGRLPSSSRGMLDTCDLVQDTMVAAVRRFGGLEVRRQGALRAYLRQAIVNRVRDLARHDRCRPSRTSLPADLVDGGASPLEQLIGSENVASYEAALERLSAKDREAIVARLELQYDYDQLAAVLGVPTANAARVAVARAMKRLAAAMRPAASLSANK